MCADEKRGHADFAAWPLRVLPTEDDLEVKLQGQLQLTGAADGGSDFAKRGGPHEGVWSRKMRMVESVEGFRAELQAHSFAKPRQ